VDAPTLDERHPLDATGQRRDLAPQLVGIAREQRRDRREVRERAPGDDRRARHDGRSVARRRAYGPETSSPEMRQELRPLRTTTQAAPRLAVGGTRTRSV
jgi:hypothetical protein